MDQREILDTTKHPFYKHAEIECFRARSNGCVCGCIAAIADRDYNVGRDPKVGTFGFYESTDSQAVADALFQAAKEWLAVRGATVLRGPMNPSINYECGVLVDGFNSSPSVMTTYNPPYYARLFEDAGLRKARDLYAYRMIREEAGAMLDKIGRAVRVYSAPSVRIRSVKLNRFDRELEAVWHFHSTAWRDNWGAAPMTLEVVRHLGPATEANPDSQAGADW